VNAQTMGCLEWMEFYDLLDTQINLQQKFELSKYVSIVPVSFHTYCHTNSISNPVFPKAESEVYLSCMSFLTCFV
jgi:hypothetical protein